MYAPKKSPPSLQILYKTLPIVRKITLNTKIILMISCCIALYLYIQRCTNGIHRCILICEHMLSLLWLMGSCHCNIIYYCSVSLETGPRPPPCVGVVDVSAPHPLNHVAVRQRNMADNPVTYRYEVSCAMCSEKENVTSQSIVVPKPPVALGKL